MTHTLVLAIDRTGRLHTARWSDVRRKYRRRRATRSHTGTSREETPSGLNKHEVNKETA